jgi:signal recognition particle receptor subunit beta
MAYLNVKERTIEAKIVYYGAGLSGKTTNLEKIKGQSTEGRAGEMMALDTDGDRTLFFDYLPFNIGKFNGCEVKVQLYTVPGQQKYSETRKKVLAAADGVVLVLDSQSGAVDKNKEILADLREHLQSNGIDVSRVPVVVQLNKRDLPTAMPVEELASAVDLPNWPRVEAVAATGQGVFETLREATKLVLQALREGARDGGTAAIKTGAQSGLDGQSLYNTLVASGIAPATAEAPAAKADAPGATRSAPAPAAAAPKESRDGKADKSTGADKSEGKKAPAGSGATPGAAAGSSTASAVTAPAVTAAGATTQPVAPPQTPAAREAAPHPTQPSVPATTATATNELIAGQRNLLRRIEQFVQEIT